MRTAGSQESVGGHLGQTLLSRPEAAEAVQNALLYFDGERYALFAWCIMPNHVHVVIMQTEGWPLQRVVHSWKSYTANEVNRILARTGAVWQREYYDRYMRDDDELSTAIAYVEQNPVKAGFVQNPRDWPWSSAGWARD